MNTKSFVDAEIKDDEFDTEIRVMWENGEILSGWYVVSGSELLSRIGMSHYVSEWGYILDDEIVQKLGKTFTFEQAYGLALPYIEANEARKASAKRELDAKFSRARETGKPVLIRQYADECDGTADDDCDIDNVYVYAMPNGTEKTERYHSY